MTAADVFSCSNPYDVWIIWIDRDASDGIGGLIIKDSGPCRSGIHCFPNIPGSHGHIPNTLVLGMNSNIADPSRHECRADISEFQSTERLCIHKGGVLFFGFLAPTNQRKRKHYYTKP